MALFNHTTRELTAKIVFYGPGLCGKTTNLRMLHGQLDRAAKGKLLSLATAQDRTIYFDLLPVELGNIKGYTVRFQICTVPGQVFYNETRKIVLRGVDGIVFVVDSQASMLSQNLESFQNLRENLREEKSVLETLPVVIQYNKRDLPSALPVAMMQDALGFSAYPFVEAVASQGRGVVETFRLASKLTFVDLLRRLQKGTAAASETAAAALVEAAEAAPALAGAGAADTVFAQPESESGPLARPVAVAASVAVVQPVSEPLTAPGHCAPGESIAETPPTAEAEPACLHEPPVGEAAVSASAASSPASGEPRPEAEAAEIASPVFEEFESDGAPDGWSATLESGFPGLDDEPTSVSAHSAPERPAVQDLATTRAIETPLPVAAVLASTAPSLAEQETVAGAVAVAAPVPALEDAVPPPGEVAIRQEDETHPARQVPDERESRDLEDPLIRALRSISEESARRQEAEARLGGRIAVLEEELSALRRELMESRSREESMRSLTEALGRRWDSLRRILSEDPAPPA